MPGGQLWEASIEPVYVGAQNFDFWFRNWPFDAFEGPVGAPTLNFTGENKNHASGTRQVDVIAQPLRGAAQFIFPFFMMFGPVGNLRCWGSGRPPGVGKLSQNVGGETPHPLGGSPNPPGPPGPPKIGAFWPAPRPEKSKNVAEQCAAVAPAAAPTRCGAARALRRSADLASGRAGRGAGRTVVPGTSTFDLSLAPY